MYMCLTEQLLSHSVHFRWGIKSFESSIFIEQDAMANIHYTPSRDFDRMGRREYMFTFRMFTQRGYLTLNPIHHVIYQYNSLYLVDRPKGSLWHGPCCNLMLTSFLVHT